MPLETFRKTKKPRKSQWKKRYSAEHETCFFVNVEDGTTVWEIPEGGEEYAESS